MKIKNLNAFIAIKAGQNRDTVFFHLKIHGNINVAFLRHKNVKKMLSVNSKKSSLEEILGYTYPKLHTGKEWYISFYAFDPVQGKMRRKRIKINHIQKITERRKYAAGVMYRISKQLEYGWNPWIEAENPKAYHTFKDVCDKYNTFLEKMFNDGNLRERTMYGYKSMLRTLISWNDNQKIPITYIYQFNKIFVSEFLDYIYLDRDNSIRTRNNYLTWLGIFDGYLLQHSYIKNKATEGIVSIKRNTYEKEREVITDRDIKKLHDYLESSNKDFMLACYILHYTLIRPKEMSYIKLSDISLKEQTIFISGKISKNKKSAVVTLPSKVIRLMIELNVFHHPSDHFLFSKGFKPGSNHHSEKQFRDFWDRKIRKELDFPKSYKFYSLKDTGITAMLRSCDTLTVRDQARHSSILMTNTYTPQDIRNANELLLNYDGIL